MNSAPALSADIVLRLSPFVLCVQIQSKYRGFVARRRYLVIQRGVRIAQASARVRVCRWRFEELRRHAAATKIQAAYAEAKTKSGRGSGARIILQSTHALPFF
jgi:hypothetical protein